jgi:hypothetical protein
VSSIVHFPYNKENISQIREWHYGVNWPSVYIIYNGKRAYVGETLDAVRRTEQHLAEDEFKEFTDICLISDKTFNKSVILDLESFLIKYMSADKSKILINGNAGVVEHNYFYREAYEDDFKEIWKILLEKGIVDQSISDIENSELFKYSPYKSLNNEQLEATYKILGYLTKVNNATNESMIIVKGGAGTGKTILAVYLIKLLVDIEIGKHVWNQIENEDVSEQVLVLSKRIHNIRDIGFVVPMTELRETMKTIFKSVDGLSEQMVLSPKEVVKGRYDLLVVDESHRLYQRKSLPNGPQEFDEINKSLMGDSQKFDETDLTELDWIIRSSRMQILFYDELQTIRVTDIDSNRFNSICKPHLYKYYQLLSQMRCKGGTGYYEYVKMILEGEKLHLNAYKPVIGYQVKVMDSIIELFEIVNQKQLQDGLCGVVTGPGWSSEENIEIEGKCYKWSGKVKEKQEVTSFISIHKSQGFDLNYAGVVFGREIYYDVDKARIEVKRKLVKDNRAKPKGKDDEMRRYLLNIYITLMTRGIYGTFVYAMDENLNEYLRRFFS